MNTEKNSYRQLIEPTMSEGGGCRVHAAVGAIHIHSPAVVWVEGSEALCVDKTVVFVFNCIYNALFLRHSVYLVRRASYYNLTLENTWSTGTKNAPYLQKHAKNSN